LEMLGGEKHPLGPHDAFLASHGVNPVRSGVAGGF
jgi:hypothetical protein